MLCCAVHGHPDPPLKWEAGPAWRNLVDELTRDIAEIPIGTVHSPQHAAIAAHQIQRPPIEMQPRPSTELRSRSTKAATSLKYGMGSRKHLGENRWKRARKGPLHWE